MSKPARYTLAALGAIALSVTSYCIGNATAQEPEPRLTSPHLAPMPALGAETAYMGLLLERSRWDEAVAAIVAQQTAEVASTPPLTSTNGGGRAQPSGGSCDGHVVPSYILQRESGCSYDAYNPTGCGGSGCIGLYQLDAKHYNGTCAGLDTSPAGQDACAQRLVDAAGLSPWGG